MTEPAMTMTDLELTGRARTHVVDLADPRCTLHRAAAQPFLDMRAAAARDGIDLMPVSGFRDFAAQLRIWNEKFRGHRALYDRNGQLLDYASLDPQQIMEAILCWSAIPGGSRHHWGSEVDVIDCAALPPGQNAKLLPTEYAAGGPFAPLTAWLDQNMARFGFFRPYRHDRGGVQPEPWHLSFAPVSVPALKQLTEPVLRDTVLECEIAGKLWVAERLSDIHRRYVVNVEDPPPVV